MFDLTGKSALVTGASGGIGGGDRRARCTGRARRWRCRARGWSRWRRWRRSWASARMCCPATCRTPTAVEALPKQAAEAMGAVDILVNNAGITRDNLFMRMSDEDWQSVIDVNLTSTLRLCRGVLRGMMKARWGRIVNISSVVGATGNPGQANYAAAKAGHGRACRRSLADEVASRGITVNCVAPGFIATAMTDKLNDDQKASILGADSRRADGRCRARSPRRCSIWPAPRRAMSPARPCM